MSNLIISSDFNQTNPQDFFGQNPIKSHQTSTGFQVYDAATGNHIYLSGQNIQYNASGQATSGTLSSIICLTGNGRETLFNLSGANIDIQYNNDQDWGSFLQELNYWLGPNPTVTSIPGGINGSETINAPAGTNQVYGYTGNTTVVYNAPSTQFTINVDNLLSPSNGTITVTQGDPLYSGNVNTLHAVQTIKFSDLTLQTSWLTKASLLHQTDAAEFNVLSQMYLAYFNRAPDAIGLNYWASEVIDREAANPGASAFSINGDIANVFSTTPEAINTYGTVTAQSSVAQLQTFVSNVYNNVLNRPPEQDGLNYWVKQLQTGESSPGSFIRDIIYAVNGQTGTADSIYLSGKTNVGSHFATALGLTDLAQAQNVMQTFNATYNTSGAPAAVAAANALTDSYASEASLTSNPELMIHLIGIHG